MNAHKILRLAALVSTLVVTACAQALSASQRTPTSTPAAGLEPAVPSPFPTVQASHTASVAAPATTTVAITPAVTAETPASSSAEIRGLPALAAGAAHTCLANTAGRVMCWGANQFGQLGSGAGQIRYLEYAPVAEGGALDSFAVVELAGLTQAVTGIAAGFYHTCVLTNGGGVQCWGQNTNGQLGDGGTTDSRAPITVQGLASGVIALAAGAAHTCALLNSGEVKCWGQNTDGQLGDGATTDRRSPTVVPALPGPVTAIAAGVNFSCALTSDGRLICWGNGANALFGAGDGTIPQTPAEVAGLGERVRAFAAGQYHLCALLESGTVACWGGLASSEEFTPRQPLRVEGLVGGVTQLAAGGGHTCALTEAGGVQCWGDNYFGQLGDGSDVGSWTPVIPMGLATGVARIASGSGHVCALLAEAGRTLWATQNDTKVRIKIAGRTLWATQNDPEVRIKIGGLMCWGDGSAGQLGDRSIRWK